MKHAVFVSLIQTVFLTAILNAQGLDVPVATIRLVRSEVIGQREFREKISRFERVASRTLTEDQKRELLDVMINEILLVQAAERANVRATDAEVINFAKATARVPNTVSDAEFRRLIEQQTGSTWDNFMREARKTFIIQKFLMSRPEASSLQNIQVSDAQVVEFFQENKDEFKNPDLVRVSHIFYDTKQRPRGTLEEIRTRANNALNRLRNNQATFEELVRLESDDESSKVRNGDLGFLARNDAQALALFGRNFLNEVFNLAKGSTATRVLESNAGLHIVRVTDKIDQRFLDLNDPVTPLSTTTVREYIRAQLVQRDQQVKIQEILTKLSADFRREATIQIFTQNF
jgi:parvulin-like peptidyl-prolyl isomerase